MELSPLTFSHNKTEYKSRRINVSDYSAIREAIRRDRLRALPSGANAEALARTVSLPVTSEQLMDFMLSVEGQVFILHRCVYEMDQTFTPAMAEEMVWAEDLFVQRLLVESKIIADPTKSSKESPNSPSSDGSPGK